ncbi:MAG: ABC transporter substrate-binding protein [Candidatus Peregrinibacteria bacterium]
MKKKTGVRVLKIFFYTIFMMVFVWVSSQLFFKNETDFLVNYARGVLFGTDRETGDGITDLRVIYPQEPTSLEPTLADSVTRQRLVNIYESLVKPDRDLEMRPGLALSWGLIDDYTWEFNLRPSVVFHDGSKFDAQDVAASIGRASLFPKSELSGATATIDSIDIIDDLTIRIMTKKPDPLLLQKLSVILIVPSEYAGESEIDTPVGSGPYKFSSWEKDKNKMVFEEFPGYWGNKAKFKKVELYSRVDKSERVNMFLRGDGDVLAFVPYDVVSTIEKRGFEIAAIPTLEVQFLLMNATSGVLEDPLSRKAVSLAIDQELLVQAVGGYAEGVSQFVSNGVFGFSPNIPTHEYDISQARQLAEEMGLSGKTIKLHLPLGLDILGEHVRKGLLDAGINVVVSYLDVDNLMKSLADKDADMYFFAFKSELGDSEDFLSTIAHSNGSYNVFDYKNENVDYLIDSAIVELDNEKRRDLLQEAMEILVDDDIIGVPLFEYETVYSFVDKIGMNPRIDGLIYFDELILK